MEKKVTMNFLFDPEDDQRIDQTEEFELTRNETEVVRRNKTTFVVKKLRPTIIGPRKYNFYFMEENDDDGTKRLTFIAKDQDSKVIGQEGLSPEHISEEYNYFI